MECLQNIRMSSIVYFKRGFKSCAVDVSRGHHLIGRTSLIPNKKSTGYHIQLI